MTLVVDASALTAIVFGEPDAEAIVALLGTHEDVLCVGSPTLVEAAIVVEAKQGPEAAADLRGLIDALGIREVPFDAAQSGIASAAWRRFGKGRHPAGLNFGDCLSYATAKSLGAELVCKGDDFVQTDLALAIE